MRDGVGAPTSTDTAVSTRGPSNVAFKMVVDMAVGGGLAGVEAVKGGADGAVEKVCLVALSGTFG